MLTVASANYIPSSSMEPTLTPGEHVLVNKLDRQLERGDIIVFADSANWMEKGADALMIKRVAGLPGDTVTCCDTEGSTFVNGVALDEPYAIREGDGYQRRYGVTVPKDSFFVLGDNRPHSADSRVHLNEGTAFVSADAVVGTAYAVRWPLRSVRLLK